MSKALHKQADRIIDSINIRKTHMDHMYKHSSVGIYQSTDRCQFIILKLNAKQTAVKTTTKINNALKLIASFR